MLISIGVNGATFFEVHGDKVEIHHEGILYDHMDDKDIDELVTFLEEFQNRAKKKYYLWKGNNDTIISHLTREDDLPSITIGGGGRREKFKPISKAFIKDKFGNFKEDK